MCRICLALVFLYAAAMKFSSLKLSPVSSRVGLGAFEDLMFRHDVIPIHLIPWVAKGVVSIEVLLGIALLTHIKPRIVSGAAFVLLLSFSTYLILVYLHNGNPTCGCFGTLSQSSLALQLIRNSLFLALAFLCAWWVKAGTRTYPANTPATPHHPSAAA